MLQIIQRQVLRDLLHPGFRLRQIFQGVDLAENENKRVVKQIVDGVFICHIPTTHLAQSV